MNTMNQSIDRQKILTFFEKNYFAVIATNSQNNSAPESAVVAFSYTENLEIFFGSFVSTRKNKNIQVNSHISLVIGWDNTNKTTIQIEGKVTLLEGEEKVKAEKEHCKRNPNSEKYINDPRQQYFKVIPYWIRYSNFSVHPQEVWELEEERLTEQY